jgi:hypothetical protein
VSLKRTEIVAKVRRDAAFMERTAVRLDYLAHHTPSPGAVVAHAADLTRTREDMRQAIQRVRADLDQLEGTL